MCAPPRRTRLAPALGVALLALGCSSEPESPAAPDPYADPSLVAARLRTTDEALVAFGQRGAGTAEGQAAGDYLSARFTAAGLQDVRFESFTFPRYLLASSSLSVTVAGAPRPMQHDVFAYSGTGQVSAALLDVGTGHPQDYAGVDVGGKVVLVTRDASFHRSSQYRLVVEHGGAAMLYVSQSPDNLIQVGTVTDPEDGAGPIPAITVGADDGAALSDALLQTKPVLVTLSVEATVQPATGRNVVGRLPGSDAGGGYLLVGAHYDSWFGGAVDNGSGVAAVVETAEAMARRAPAPLGLVFVAYDGEELGLFGGYDYLRRHFIVAGEPLLGFVNFEMPASGPSDLTNLAHTNDGPFDAALRAAELHGLYDLYVGMEVVPALFGGVVPTDIQGMYRAGVHGTSTACDSPYYHTPEDTPDKLDFDFLAQAVLDFEHALAELQTRSPADFSAPDHALYGAEVQTTAATDGLRVEVTVRDAAGVPQPSIAARAWLDVDDFFRAADVSATTDAQGQASLLIPAAALTAGSGARWLHLTAGPDYPLVEKVSPVD